MKSKLTFKEKCGYGSAAIGDAICYTLPGTYMLFFLTTVAGLSPAVAGTITAVAAVWDAIWNPIVGYLSDHHVSKSGRRRPFLFCFAGPLVIATILLFTNVDMGYGVKVIYYGLMCIVYWTAFTGFFVPFYALGAEYSDDYDERSLIRSFASFFNSIGCFISMALPSLLVEKLEEAGLSTARAWTIMAAISGLIAGGSILITAIASKGKDICPETIDENAGSLSAKKSGVLTSLFGDFRDVLKLKPAKYLLLASLGLLISYSFFSSDMMYFLTYNMGFDGGQKSAALLLKCLLGMALIPLGSWTCRKTDNKTALIIYLIIGVVALSMIRIFVGGNGTTGILTLALVLIFSSTCTSFYWQIMPMLAYELCVYDEYLTGKKREGVILSLQGLIETISAGIGTWLLGIILQMSGFNGEAISQSAMAETSIFNCVTFIPAIFMVFAVVCLIGYPINREKFNEMRDEIDRKQ